jgi:lysylphosphatidylglycerol synthetase-like protein (DUF2156 family)
MLEKIKKLEKPLILLSYILLSFYLLHLVTQAVHAVDCTKVKVQSGNLGFEIPTFADLLTFAIRGFFTIAGLAALFFLLQGAFEWVTSGGAKDKVEAAQKRMSAAVIGVVMIVVALAIVWTMENIVFAKRICFGLSCAVTIPQLLTPTAGDPNPCP